MAVNIQSGGCGGFLNPPGHPEHTISVGDRDTLMCLSSAAKESWVPERVRSQAQSYLDGWMNNRPAIDSDDVRKWIHRVLGYFKGCYENLDKRESGENWDASHLIIDKRDPLQFADYHAGVNCIRQYYPEYVPTQSDFDNAKWGN